MHSTLQTLLQLPLFAGESLNSIAEIVGRHPFHFLKYSDKEIITASAEPYTHLKAIINGIVRASAITQEGNFTIEYTLKAPDIIASDYLFGRTIAAPATYTALGDTGILEIDKSDLVSILQNNKIVLFNYLNHISSLSQSSRSLLMSTNSGNPLNNLLMQAVLLSQSSATEIAVRCRKSDFTALPGYSTQKFNNSISKLIGEGIISYSPSAITIVDRKSLIDYLTSKNRQK